jgi:hypothetical protein
MPSFAMLIDGGFLKRRIGTARQPMTAATLQEFVGRPRQLDVANRDFKLVTSRAISSEMKSFGNLS